MPDAGAVLRAGAADRPVRAAATGQALTEGQLSLPDVVAWIHVLMEDGATIREAFEACGGVIRFVNNGSRIHADCCGLSGRHSRSPSKACAHWLHQARARKGH